MPALRLFLALTLVTPPALAAQAASPYVPLDHWGMPFVEHLISAGRLADPTPLTRPLRAADLARALAEADTMRLSGAERAVVRRLVGELALAQLDTTGGQAGLEGARVNSRLGTAAEAATATPVHGQCRAAASAAHSTPPCGAAPSPAQHTAAPWVRIEAHAGLSAATHSLRDPLSLGRGLPARPDRPARGFASGGLDLRLAAGPVVAVTHPYFDTRLKYDPEWHGKKDRAIAGTTAESYVSAQWRWGEVFFGRIDRNWGPSAAQGALLSGSPYGMDHLAVTIGTSRLRLEGYVTQLDALTDTAGASVRRHLVLHRVWARPSERWAVSVWEGLVLSGADRALEPWYANLLNLGVLEQVNSGTNVNSFVGLDVEWGGRGRVTLFGQAMLDDIQVDRKTPTDEKPTSYALTVGAKGPLAAGSWSAFYTRVANLTYRNEDDFQVPLFHGLGTGRNFADYEQATLRLGLVAAGALLSPEVTLLRQGEGDPRLPHPLPPAYAATPTLFEGVVERTLRLALAVRWQGGPLGVVADGGAHVVSNAGHQREAERTRFVGSLGVVLRFGAGGAAP